jgi:hypothetical protein
LQNAQPGAIEVSRLAREHLKVGVERVGRAAAGLLAPPAAGHQLECVEAANPTHNSYLTIELLKDQLPTEFQGKMDNWAFGCDVTPHEYGI